jgi:CRP/FNR family cyclic AMP-dependent transcriptional regulator
MTMKRETLLKLLGSMEFTRGLEPKHLEKLASIAKDVPFAEGETIFHEGDLDDEVYLIQEGQVAVEIHVPGRGRVTILTVGPGQLLAWSSLFPPQHKTATGRALSPTRAISMNGVQLREACEKDHDLGYAVAWHLAGVIAERLKATRLQLLDMFAPETGPQR